MKESFLPRYYSLDRIPDYRNHYIDLRIKWFIETYCLKSNDWPLDCVSLIKKMKQTQNIPFTYGCLRLPDKYDAITEFIPEHDVYIMQLNKSKINYPYEYSRDRRLNFTIAHEIGHIALEHLLIPRNIKSEEQLLIEEHEANEFAGRLIMPNEVIFTCNYYSLDAVSEYFVVSKTALWKRLNNMKRLDLLHSRKVRSCQQCGNTRFSPFAEFCGICGQLIRGNLNGIRRLYYPEAKPMDRYKRVEYCPKCNNQIKAGSGEICSVCSTYIFNFCTSYFEDNSEECSYANPGNCRFCEMCGKPTYYNTNGFLKSWDVIPLVSEESALYKTNSSI